MKIYICNAFALSMLNRGQQSLTKYGGDAGPPLGLCFPRTPKPVEEPARFIQEAMGHGVEIVSALGHGATRGLFEATLGIPVAVNRINLQLGVDEMVLVGQYVGPRLPEGATELPDGATLEWWVV